MTIGPLRASVLVAAILAFTTLSASPARAQALPKVQIDCFKTIAKASQSYVKGKLKVVQKCRNANLKDGSCATPDPSALGKLVTKLNAALDKGCGLAPNQLENMGFPGPCSDVTPGDDFDADDLKACILESHDTIIDEMLALQYDATVTGPLASADLKCQAEVAKQSAALSVCILKNVQKCRNDILKGKALGVPPDFCATDHAKTAAAIAKCEGKLTAGIAKKCLAGQITSLKVCDPDQGDAGTAATCLIAGHTVRTDGSEITVPPDLIDYEFAVRGGLCGDNVVNNLNEECDGPDDGACPGQCGTAETPDGFFACLCKTKPRAVIVHDAAADTDNGWTGLSSDGDVVDGSGYIVDLYDCDMMTGLCNAGPSCSLPPHSPCGVPAEAAPGTTSDSICAGLGQGVCRKERTATGPHCYQDPQKKCSPTDAAQNEATCNAPGDYCVTTFLGGPVAQVAGGIAVCNVSILAEDVVGTLNILTGEGSLSVRQRAITRNPLSQHKPCPVCGGFCGVSRERCDVDADCAPGQGPCITAAVCSDGLRKDKACRRTAPFGGPIPFFGVTSMDCPPSPVEQGLITNASGLDVDTTPRGTASYTLVPNIPCSGAGFTGNTCRGGISEGRPCTVASECPGGTCSPQCFCVGQSRPNQCNPACVGGASDADLCATDGDCPGGFCHPGDCRHDPSDLDSNQEGICTSGPSSGFCSLTSFKNCTSDVDCAPPICTFCQMGETCEQKKRACFVNSGITRNGAPGFPDRTTASVYCVPTNAPAINVSAGFAGPGALIQNETLLVVP